MSALKNYLNAFIHKIFTCRQSEIPILERFFWLQRFRVTFFVPTIVSTAPVWNLGYLVVSFFSHSNQSRTDQWYWPSTRHQFTRGEEIFPDENCPLLHSHLRQCRGLYKLKYLHTFFITSLHAVWSRFTKSKVSTSTLSNEIVTQKYMTFSGL